MHCVTFVKLVCCCLLVTAMTVANTGCDQVQELTGQKPQPETTGEADSHGSTDVGTTNTAPVAPPTPQPTASAPPSPQDIAARFSKLKAHEVSDSALAEVASHPEAAVTVTALETNTDKLTGLGLSELSALPNLTTLKIVSKTLTADDFSAVSRAGSLTKLEVADSHTNDAVIQKFAELPQLKKLNISGTEITADAGAGLSQMVNLTELNLSATQADDSTVAALTKLPLRSLDLSRTQITNAALPHLLNMPTLEVLNVSLTGVTGPGFKGFSRSSIRELNVSETSFGIEGFAAIKGMKQLENLKVLKAGLVEHKAANVFRSFPELKRLNAGANSVTDAGMDVFFKGHRSLEELILAGNKPITDNGLAALTGVGTLRLLDVTDTLCGGQGAMALKKRLPQCRILTRAGEF